MARRIPVVKSAINIVRRSDLKGVSRRGTAEALLAALVLLTAAGARAQPLVERHRNVAERIVSRAVRDSAAWNRIATLTETFGHRLSGSESLERAIDWMLAEMRRDGLENVRGEPVMVPHWVRGEESLELLQPRREVLPMLGLGGSVATPSEGIEAEVMVVRSFRELDARSVEARGRIVLFNVPFTTYGETVRYRTTGAIAAARAGAVAALLRSVTPYSMRTPHTGATSYDSTVRAIPFAAITTEDADMLERMAQRGSRPVVRLKMSARTLPDAASRNVVAEMVGRERSEEVVVLGGHIDSWDVGRGAMDDAGGVVAAWEALRILKELGLRPRRTIRVVGWTNEENGLRGATAYRDRHRDQLHKHVLAIESDAGVFRPLGFGFTGSDSAFAIVQQIGKLLEPIGAGTMTRGGGGADIGPIMATGVPGMGLNVDASRYFWYHHSHADTVDKLDPAEVGLCVAALAIVAYVAAEEGLPR
jgi:carboxypeptidase Q